VILVVDEPVALPVPELAAALDEAHTLEHASRIVAKFAVSCLDVDVAGVITYDADGFSSALAVTGQVLLDLHAERNALGSGPGALACGSVVTVSDTRHGERWPEWSAAAARHGVLSLRLLGLQALRGQAATLDLCSPRADSFGSDDLARHMAGAEHIGLALRLIDRIEHLEEAMQTRDEISRAQGIVMERHSVNADEAMAFLRRVSQSSQVKVRQLARDLTSETKSAVSDPEVPHESSPGSQE
jgi:hypothetical protein